MSDEAKLIGRLSKSIALRMATWYALSAFVLIFVATGFLYWVLATNLAREDSRTLADNLDSLRLLLRSSPTGVLSRRPDQAQGSGTLLRRPQSYFRILDDGGQIVLETPGLSSDLPPPTPSELTAITSTEVSSRDAISASGGQFQILSARVSGTPADNATRFVQVAMDRGNDGDLLARYRQWLLLVLSLSVVICSVVGYVIAKAGLRPIKSIGQTAERIRSTTLYERIDTLGLPVELFGLANTFNSMLDRLQDSFASISKFSDDVAHELRSPISNLLGEIEVTLGRPRSNEEYRETLGSCLEECTRISRVIQSLLFLARAENAPELLEREVIDVHKELAAVQEFYEAAAVEAGVDLRLSAVAQTEAFLGRTLFQQAVGNLVSNAIAKTPKGGMIQIAACADAAWLEVSVTDTGCGIAAEHLPHVLDRFYRVDRARSGASHHVGLGLAIVKSIVERHAGTIEIDSEMGHGTQVTLRFQRPTG